MNVHLRVTEPEYRRILAEAKKQGLTPEVQSSDKGPLFASLQVKLFVSPQAERYKYLNICDGTYSRTLARVEEPVK